MTEPDGSPEGSSAPRKVRHVISFDPEPQPPAPPAFPPPPPSGAPISAASPPPSAAAPPPPAGPAFPASNAGTQPSPRLIDLTDFHDWSKRIHVFDDQAQETSAPRPDDLRVVDGEPFLAPGESELARLAGVVRLGGPRSTPDSDEPTLGPVLMAASIGVVTTERLIFMCSDGDSSIGKISPSSVQCFVVPWDLIDILALPVKKSMTDRIAGGRSIELFMSCCATSINFMATHIERQRDKAAKIKSEEALALIVGAAATHRKRFSAAGDHPRLDGLLQGQYQVADGEYYVELSLEAPGGELPPHLEGRAVLRD